MLGRCQVIFGAGFPVAEQLIPTIFSESLALSGLGISLVSTLGSEMAVKNKETKSVGFCPMFEQRASVFIVILEEKLAI